MVSSVRLSRGALAAFGACALAVACGTSRPNELGDEGSVPPPVGGGGANDGGDTTFGADGGNKPPNCGVGPDGGVCDCLDVGLLSDVPNLYFVLDRSGSMNDSDKWTTVRVVVQKTVSKLGPRVNVGAAVFPDPVAGECTPGGEVMSVRAGDPALTYGPTNRALVASLNMPAAGGTPTAATLNALLPKLRNLPGRTYVILATDGGPNCNSGLVCSVDECIPNIERAGTCVPGQLPNCCDPSSYGPTNCLDSRDTLAAVNAYRQAGIPVYIIGVPGSGPYAALLDQMAQSGGTARASDPLYYKVDSTDAAAFTQAMSQVAAKITASCTLTLKQAPPDPHLVNVYLDEVVVPKDPVNGWDIQGATVTLLGSTCNRVLGGEVLDVRVITGCPTVLK